MQNRQTTVSEGQHMHVILSDFFFGFAHPWPGGMTLELFTFMKFKRKKINLRKIELLFASSTESYC